MSYRRRGALGAGGDPMAHDHIPKGLQFAVLRTIPLLGSDAYGTEIHARLERNASKDIPTAQVFLALQAASLHEN